MCIGGASFGPACKLICVPVDVEWYHTRLEKMEEKPLLSVSGEKTTLLTPCQQSGSRGCLRRDYCPCIPARYVLAVMINLGFAVVYGLRVNLSVAIVQMDNDTATVHHGSAKVLNPINQLFTK